MKSPFLKALLLVSAAAPASFAYSLYDTAPAVGMPESYAVKYNSYLTVGYDDNLNASSRNQEDGMFTQLGAGAAYSDQESVTRISYNVNLGARLYDKSAEGSSRELFADCRLSAALSHSFTATSAYTTTLSMNLSPDLNIADSISAAYTQGEVYRWTWSHAYSQAIDARWSWTANASYSGNLHTSDDYARDDRQYLNAGLTLSYRYSSLTTYSLSSSYRMDFRDEGENSENIYLNLGITHSLTPISSLYATVGVQAKFIAGNTDLYPNLRLGYRRTITEGLSANIYASLDNENVGTGYSLQNTYLSDETIRLGANLEYRWTHKVSFHADASLLHSDYSKHTGGAQDKEEKTWVLSIGMRYKFTEHLSGLIDYQYTSAEQEWGDYHRNKISTGVTYSF